jgi:hypothetical protein
MKRKRPVFNSLKALDDLQDADLSIKQAKGIVRVIEFSQENLTAADELQESERDVKAHTDAKHTKAMSAITVVKHDFAKFLTATKVSIKTGIAFISIGGTLAMIAYYLYSLIRG